MTRAVHSLPVLVSAVLLLSACGGGSEQVAAPGAVNRPASSAPAPASALKPASTGTAPAAAVVAPRQDAAGKARTEPRATPMVPRTAVAPAAKAPVPAAANAGATDVGVTKDSIRLGSVNMHGMALANVITTPMVNGNLAAVTAINDRGGVLGRRLQIVDCDDGPGEVSRAKACIKRLVVLDRIFSLISGVDWATASIHDDLRLNNLPYVGSWAYSQTEWQDPYMFPTHMSMIHEALAGAHWVADVVRPRTYGLICLTSPEMQLACSQVQQVLDASGAKLVKKADVSISETSMAAQVLAFRAANPDHIVHYVINPATILKFIVEAAQQGYWPAKGISGNHVASETMGSLIGTFPVNRYWFNTTYRLWGSEFMATIDKYAPGNRGINHHIVQAGYVGVNMFAKAAAQVGPDLTRDRLRAALGNGAVWTADSSLDQKFAYTPAERTGSDWNQDYGQGREFMYRYSGTNTVSSPDGSPTGFSPDSTEFVIHAR